MKSISLVVRMDESMLAQIQEAAFRASTAQMRVSTAEWVRRAIEEKLERDSK